MDRWTDRRMNVGELRRTGRWMDRWMDGWMDGWVNKWMYAQTDGQMNGWTDRQIDRLMDGRQSGVKRSMHGVHRTRLSKPTNQAMSQTDQPKDNETYTVMCTQHLRPASKHVFIKTLFCNQFYWLVLIVFYLAKPNVKCGLNKYGGVATDKTKKIVGGQEARPNEFPWLVPLYQYLPTIDNGYSYQQICGAAVISSQYIVTEGHCFGETTGYVPNWKKSFEFCNGKFCIMSRKSASAPATLVKVQTKGKIQRSRQFSRKSWNDQLIKSSFLIYFNKESSKKNKKKWKK